MSKTQATLTNLGDGNANLIVEQIHDEAPNELHVYHRFAITLTSAFEYATNYLVERGYEVKSMWFKHDDDRYSMVVQA